MKAEALAVNCTILSVEWDSWGPPDDAGIRYALGVRQIERPCE